MDPDYYVVFPGDPEESDDDIPALVYDDNDEILDHNKLVTIIRHNNEIICTFSDYYQPIIQLRFHSNYHLQTFVNNNLLEISINNEVFITIDRNKQLKIIYPNGVIVI